MTCDNGEARLVACFLGNESEKSMMKSQRTDGRGHWPAGRRRNDQAPPKGWPTMDDFLAEVAGHCSVTRGAAAELAESLGVHHSTLQAWLSGRKWPARPTATRIARWYRGQLRRRG